MGAAQPHEGGTNVIGNVDDIEKSEGEFLMWENTIKNVQTTYFKNLKAMNNFVKKCPVFKVTQNIKIAQEKSHI